MTKKCEIRWEFSKCDTETWRVNAIGQMVPRDTQHRVATDLQFVKNVVSAKCKRAKCIKKNKGMPTHKKYSF